MHPFIIHPYFTHIVNNDLNYITEYAYPHFIGESQSVWYLLVVRFVCVIRVSVPCVSRLHRGSRDPKFRKIETSRDPAMERNQSQVSSPYPAPRRLTAYVIAGCVGHASVPCDCGPRAWGVRVHL
jgi:hypothetical protein